MAQPERMSEERQLALLVTSAADYAIFMLDPQGHVLTWNVGAERLKGYAREEIVGTHFSTFYTEEDRTRDHPATPGEPRDPASVRELTHERPFAPQRAGYQTSKTTNEGDTSMPTTQTVKRRTAATKRSTTAKKAAGTRARKTAASNASRAKTNVKRTVNRPTSSTVSKQVRPLAAQAEFVGAVVTNTVQTVITGGTKVVAGAAKRVANIL